MKVWNSLLIIFAISLISCAKKEVKAPLPNFIHIFCDDMGYGDIACFGASDIKTPNIDLMAENGIRFTDFYSASSVCSPSRAGLLTGRMPQRMGINAVFFPESYTGMPDSEVTIAEMLKAKNYATGIVGKWHLGHRHEFLPLQQGFDYYYGIPYSNDMKSVVYMDGNKVDSLKVNQHYITQTYTQKAKAFIKKHQKEPFFLYLAHNMPHVPIYASPKFEGSSNRGLYGDVIQELDWSVGQIIAQLEELGLLENTLIVFSSDNGPWLVMEDHAGSAAPLRSGKMYSFEGGMRVPTIAMWKGKILSNVEVNDLATQMDWFPTFAKLAGIEPANENPIDGKDISPLLLGTGKRATDDYLFFEMEKLTGYRKGAYKLKLPFEGYKGSEWKNQEDAHDSLLINLRKDIGEQVNILSENPGKALELSTEMQQKYKEMGQLPASLTVTTAADESHFKHLANKK
ncbi:MAG: sulfatase [Prolixibacteraceae bacterium]